MAKKEKSISLNGCILKPGDEELIRPTKIQMVFYDALFGLCLKDVRIKSSLTVINAIGICYTEVSASTPG